MREGQRQSATSHQPINSPKTLTQPEPSFPANSSAAPQFHDSPATNLTKPSAALVAGQRPAHLLLLLHPYETPPATPCQDYRRPRSTRRMSRDRTLSRVCSMRRDGTWIAVDTDAPSPQNRLMTTSPLPPKALPTPTASAMTDPPSP